MPAPNLRLTMIVEGAEPVHKVVSPGEYVIGRAPESDIVIDDEEISRQHAKLVVSDGMLYVEDLGSRNGVLLDGQPVVEQHECRPGQRIQLGKATFFVGCALPEEFGGSRYAIGAEIQRGGMGAILRAQESTTGRDVAMKVMLSGESSDNLRRFLTEARVTAKLEHPNIVPVHELGVNDRGEVFYTMKLVRGATLREVLKQLAAGDAGTIAKYPLIVLLTVFQKVCDALAFAHSRNVIHRDLKPDNIMLGPFGEVLVMDWGLAKVLRSSLEEAGDDAAEAVASDEPPISHPDGETPDAQTMQGKAMGTAPYMAPEQAAGKIDELDARTDLYALGAILYEILALRRPVSGRSVNAILLRVIEGDLDPLVLPSLAAAADEDADLPPELRRPKIPRPALRHLPGGVIPASLVAVIQRSLAFEREDRYQSVPELQREITAYQNGFATSAEQASLAKQILLALRRHRAVAAVAATALLLLLTLATASFLRIRSERDTADLQRRRAEHESAIATEQRTLADAAKQRAVASKKAADELISFMQYDLRDTLGKLGQLKMMEGINVRVRKYHEDYPPEVGDDGTLREKGTALSEQGDILLAQGQINDAFEAYSTAFAICQRLAAKDPDNAEWQRDLSVSHGKLGGILLAQGQLADALKAYNADLAICQRLAAKDPDNAEWQRDLSVSHVNVGDILQAQGQLADALKAYNAYLAISQRLAAKDPNNADSQIDLAAACGKVVTVLLHQPETDRQEAQHLIRQGLAILDSLGRKNPPSAHQTKCRVWLEDLQQRAKL